jgi:hypothetical protein
MINFNLINFNLINFNSIEHSGVPACGHFCGHNEKGGTFRVYSGNIKFLKTAKIPQL